jgi:hypothetical protein
MMTSWRSKHVAEHLCTINDLFLFTFTDVIVVIPWHNRMHPIKTVKNTLMLCNSERAGLSPPASVSTSKPRTRRWLCLQPASICLLRGSLSDPGNGEMFPPKRRPVSELTVLPSRRQYSSWYPMSRNVVSCAGKRTEVWQPRCVPVAFPSRSDTTWPSPFKSVDRL